MASQADVSRPHELTKLKAKTNFSDVELLDVTMTVCTYKLAPGSEAAEPGGAP